MGRERDNAEEEVGMLHGPAHVNRFILKFFLALCDGYSLLWPSVETNWRHVMRYFLTILGAFPIIM